MGKSNRIRANKAMEAAKKPLTKKKKNGMPSWAMTLITLAVTVAILLSVVLGLLSANGVFNRARTSVSSDNYKINTNMMSYYFYTQYQSFQSEYQSYISYLSLDTSKSLKKQMFGGDGTKTYYDTTFLGEFQGTWFDFFMNATVEAAKGILLYCEEADARGITLDETELAEIEASIDTMRSTAALYGYTVNSYLAQNYGSGVHISDVRRAMQYSALATKCMNAVIDELELKVTDDRINAKYDGNKTDFNVVDYSIYTFKVDYEDIKKNAPAGSTDAEILKLYQDAVKDAKEKAEALKGAATADDFMKMICEYVAEDSFDKVYDAQKIEAADKPSDEDKAAIRAAMLADVIAELMEGKTTADPAVTVEEGAETVTVYEKTVTAAYAKILNTVKTNLFSAVNTEKKKVLVDRAGHVHEDDFSEWAFADGRVADEKKVIVTGDGKDEGEVQKKDGYSYVNVYYLRSAQYRNDENARDVAYMVFSKEADAKTAIAELIAKETMDLTVFETYATEKKASGHTHIEDCTRGYLGSDPFDEWLYGSDTKLGDITAEPLKLDSSNFCVAYYYGEGDAHWYLSVKDTILSEDYDAYEEAMEGKYAINVNDRANKKVNA